MAYTRRKAATINLMYFLYAFLFSGFAFYFLLKNGSRWQAEWPLVVVPGVIALVIAAFPVSWLLLPNRHPVRRAISRHGDPENIGATLDREMEISHEIFGPFHFTKSYLVYETGYTLDVLPYDVIVGAEVVAGYGEDSVTKIVVVSRADVKAYEWYNTFIQGYFNAHQVLARIQSAARLEVRRKP